MVGQIYSCSHIIYRTPVPAIRGKVYKIFSYLDRCNTFLRIVDVLVYT